LLYLWPFERFIRAVSLTFRDFSAKKRKLFSKSGRAFNFFSSYRLATWFWNLNNGMLLNFDKSPSNTLYWMFQKNTAHLARYIFILHASKIIKFGKCAHGRIIWTQLRKIHPSKIGLKRLPETVDRFNRGISVRKVYMRPCTGSCII